MMSSLFSFQNLGVRLVCKSLQQGTTDVFYERIGLLFERASDDENSSAAASEMLSTVLLNHDKAVDLSKFEPLFHRLPLKPRTLAAVRLGTVADLTPVLKSGDPDLMSAGEYRQWMHCVELVARGKNQPIISWNSSLQCISSKRSLRTDSKVQFKVRGDIIQVLYHE